jgi:hypothetical protein
VKVEVDCYAGYRGDERPVRVRLGGQVLEVAEVQDRWYSPGESYFRVRVKDGESYVLKRSDAQDVWSLEAYRKAAN